MGFVSRSIVLGQNFHGFTGWSFKNSPFEMKDNPDRLFKTEDIIESQCFVFTTVKLQAVDQKLFNFGPICPSIASKLPFINSLKILGCAANRDSLLLATLQ